MLQRDGLRQADGRSPADGHAAVGTELGSTRAGTQRDLDRHVPARFTEHPGGSLAQRVRDGLRGIAPSG
nr:hypothetical protein [Actinomadura soli]